MSRTAKLFRRLDELEGEYLKLAAADLKQYLRGALSLIHCSLFPDTFLAHRLDRNEVERFRWLEKEIEGLRIKLEQPVSESPVGQMRMLLQQLHEEQKNGTGMEFRLVKELLKRLGCGSPSEDRATSTGKARASMSNADEDDAPLFESFALWYVYVFWKQAYPAPFEVVALHEVDPHLRSKSLSEVEPLLMGQDVWRIGPFGEDSEANAIASQLRALGLTVEQKLQ